MADLPEIAKNAGLMGVGGGAVLIITQLLGGLAKGWLTGTAGQEKELRSDLVEEVKRLRDDLKTARAEIDELREDMKRLTSLYLHVLTGRAEARAALNAVERGQGLPVTVWPPDPQQQNGGN